MPPTLDFDTLLAPVPGTNPCGVEAVEITEFEAIREARRADDPSLAQGDWQTELKKAEWPKVVAIASKVLAEKSKDLQIAAWLTEASTRLRGYEGLAEGLTLTRRLLETYWDSLHPMLEGEDSEVRAGRLAWFDTQLPAVVREIPMTKGGKSDYGWIDWKTGLDIDNVARRDPAAAQQRASEGAVTTALFEKAVAETPVAFYRTLVEQAAAARTSYDEFAATVDRLFGKAAPSLRSLAEAIADGAKLANQLARTKGVATMAETGGGAAAPTGEAEGALSAEGAGAAPAGGPLRSREDAFRQLAEVAQFFRASEPHSPVPHLIERAIKWGRMPLDQWLEEAIKDAGVISSVRELLGIVPKPEDGGQDGS